MQNFIHFELIQNNDYERIMCNEKENVCGDRIPQKK